MIEEGLSDNEIESRLHDKRIELQGTLNFLEATLPVSSRPNEVPTIERVKTSRSRSESARSEETRGDKTGRAMALEMDKIVDEMQPSARLTDRSADSESKYSRAPFPTDRSYASSEYSEFTPRTDYSDDSRFLSLSKFQKIEYSSSLLPISLPGDVGFPTPLTNHTLMYPTQG